MVFNNPLFLSIVFCIVLSWLIMLSIMIFRAVSHYNALTKGVNTKTLQEVLMALLKKQDHSAEDIETIKKEISWLQSDGTLHLQRLGIVRFNPFSDTGGSQSFTLSILDGQDNGIVMTSLYARTGNRWYIKHIKQGVSPDVELSKEEQLAIKKARPVNA